MNSINSNSDNTSTNTTTTATTTVSTVNELKGSHNQNSVLFSAHQQQHQQQQRNNYALAPTPPGDLLYHHAGTGSSSSTAAGSSAFIGSGSMGSNNTFGSINKATTATVDGTGNGSVNNTTTSTVASSTNNIMSGMGSGSGDSTTSSSLHDYDSRQSINNGGTTTSLVGLSMGGNAAGAATGSSGSGGGSASGFSKPQERYVWEMRARSPNVTPASTVLNSPDLNTDMQYSIHPHQRQLQQIRVGRSPGSQFEQHNILPQVGGVLIGCCSSCFFWFIYLYVIYVYYACFVVLFIHQDY